MKAFVSLWSADQLALGEAIETLDPHVDGFHLDIMDGHFVHELLFGPETVRAISARKTKALIDVHLIVADADSWVEPFAAAGAQVLTVHPQSCPDVARTRHSIESNHIRPGVALTLDMPVAVVVGLLERVDRVLVMGTATGVKGAEMSASVYPRIRRIVDARDRSDRRPEIVVDGGIPRIHSPATWTGRRGWSCSRLSGIRRSGLAEQGAVHPFATNADLGGCHDRADWRADQWR